MKLDETIPVQIVRMKENDISCALEILTENNLETWRYNDFFSEIQRSDSIVLAGIMEDEIVGFCIMRLIIPFESLPPNISDKNNSYTECEIYNIAVKKKFQKRGIGKQLLCELVLFAIEHQSQSIWLEVRNSNNKAINFYRRNNFKQIYERKNFYSNPSEAAIVMKRNL